MEYCGSFLGLRPTSESSSYHKRRKFIHSLISKQKSVKGRYGVSIFQIKLLNKKIGFD